MEAQVNPTATGTGGWGAAGRKESTSALPTHFRLLLSSTCNGIGKDEVFFVTERLRGPAPLSQAEPVAGREGGAFTLILSVLYLRVKLAEMEAHY